MFSLPDSHRQQALRERATASMALRGPALESLKSWKEAFDYPLPVTRRVEKSLRGEVASNKDRLRTLVGVSYRELLTTAERITNLDDRMQEAEASLAELGLECHADVIGRKMEHLTASHQDREKKVSMAGARAAQMLVLQKCRSYISTLLKQRGSILLAAKLLAISRLLHKNLCDSMVHSTLLDTFRQHLSSLRRKLLQRIDRCLIDPHSSLNDLVEAVCSFSLVTSSSLSDAIRHFQRLRLDEICTEVSHREFGHGHILQAFKYYLSSVRTTVALLGRSLSQTLQSLRNQPILQDPSVFSLEELELSAYWIWLAPEIRSYVPFIKHVGISEDEVQNITSSWSRQAFSGFVEILRIHVSQTSTLSDLIALRKAIVEAWLPVCVSTPLHSTSEVLDGLRSPINARMQQIIRMRTEELRQVGIAISSRVSESCTEDGISSSLWEKRFVTASLENSSSAFKHQLRRRHLGLTQHISTILKTLNNWIQTVRHMNAAIDSLRKEHWRDIVEEDDADDEMPLRVGSTLQTSDPDAFRRIQDAAVSMALESLQASVQNAVDFDQTQSISAETCYLIRIIRELQQRLHRAFPSADLGRLEGAVPRLHDRLALDVTRQLHGRHIFRSSSRSLGTQRIYDLWEGSPLLPTQPSPPIFKLLRRLSHIMTEQGADIWTPAAVTATKAACAPAVIRILLGAIPSISGLENRAQANGLNERDDDSIANGEAPPDRPLCIGERNQQIQLMFDLLYLRCAFVRPFGIIWASTTPEDVFNEPVERFQRLCALDSQEFEVLEKRASVYWLKTGLLFGVLT